MDQLEIGERPPWIVAHRGVSARYPENTRAAFDAAVDAGADALEFDVQLSGDEELLVCHDRTLERFGHPHHHVRSREAGALRRLDMGGWFNPVFSGERMPTAAEVLARYGRVLPLCLELKVRDEPEERKERIVSSVLAELAGAGLDRLVYLLSFDADLLERFHVAAPRLRLVWNLRASEPPSESDVATRTWLFGLDAHIDLLTPDLVRLGHDHGLRVLTYTCNRPDEVRKALRAGADALIVDDPEAARAVLLERT